MLQLPLKRSQQKQKARISPSRPPLRLRPTYRNVYSASMHSRILCGILGFAAACHGFAPTSFTCSLAAHSPVAKSSPHLLSSVFNVARQRRCPQSVRMQSDDLSGVFSGTEVLGFDSLWTDQENLSINGAKATKVACLASNILQGVACD